MGDERQQDLERLAFGDGTPAAEREAALRELLTLRSAAAAPAGRDASVAAAATAGAAAGSRTREATARGLETEAATETETDGDAEALPTEPARRPRRRTLTAAGVLAATLAVGLIGGAAISSAMAPHQTSPAAILPSHAAGIPTDPAGADAVDAQAAAAGTTAPDPVATSGTGTSTDTPARGSIAGAERLLDLARVKDDTYPIDFDLNDTFNPATTRLIATVNSQVRIYIARQPGSGKGYCLLSATVETTGAGSSGSAGCATRKEFAAQGLSIGENSWTATWTGDSVTVNVGTQG